jgi:hypothetical protein
MTRRSTYIGRTGRSPKTLLLLAISMTALFSMSSQALSPETDARAGIMAFAENCFSPRLTAGKAAKVFGIANVTHDFYDLEPFTDAAPSPATNRAATPGTDRRCEVAFFGDYTDPAVQAVTARLTREGITTPVETPAIHEDLRTSGTALLAARRLNRQKIAVVHVGTRPGPNGVETFLNVERLRSPK